MIRTTVDTDSLLRAMDPMEECASMRQSGERVFLEAFAAGLMPEPKLTVTEWANRFRVLTSDDSSEIGLYRSARTPYAEEIMNTLSPQHPARRVVFWGGHQIGKTAILLNFIGCAIDTAPGPMLMIQPTIDMARKVSKQRLTPMISECPTLRRKVRALKSRDSGNTTFTKQFMGGVLMLTGANSASGLKSMPIRYLLCDEIDEYPGDVEGQGDPIGMAELRVSTYSRIAKIYLASTCTIKGLSRIEKAYLASDQRRYYVPCPACGNFDWIRWKNIEWENRDPATARLRCDACGERIQEHHKTAMLAGGQWRATAESPDGTVGFHLSALYSPIGWLSWAGCVQRFLMAENDDFNLKTVVNQIWAETWEERGAVDPDSIWNRIERFQAPVPHGVGLIVAAVDVHAKRLELQVVGWGHAEESWLISWQQIEGDPARPEVWAELDRHLACSFRHEGGREVRIDLVVVDSGYLADQVYEYCATRDGRGGRRVFAIKGNKEIGKPLVGRPSRNNKLRIPLYGLCVDTGKDTVYGRLRIGSPGPGFMHLADFVDREYVDQLTAETPLRKKTPDRGIVRVWTKNRARNEAFDLWVYSLAALYMFSGNVIRGLAERAATLSRPPAETNSTMLETKPAPEEPAIPAPETNPSPAETRPSRRRRSGWVDKWRV